MKTTLVALCCLFLFAFAASAQAAQRYASPIGGGSECSQGNPCGLEEAIEGAKENDEVIVGGGTYQLKKSLADPEKALVLPQGKPGIYLHGDFGGPMPTLIAAGGPYETALSAEGEGDRIAWLEVLNASNGGGGIYCGPGARVERVRVHVSGSEFARGISLTWNSVVSDSLAVASGAEGIAVAAGGEIEGIPAVIRNVTAIGTGPDSSGVSANYPEPFEKYSFRLNVINSIASGVFADLFAGSTSEGAEINVSYSNFDTPVALAPGKIVNGSGNQTAAPIFVNAAAGDYREAAGSPTIDGGLVAAGLGTLDLAGNPRVIGASVDIGAYEFVPSASPPPPATVPGKLERLSISPKSFPTATSGGAVLSKKSRRIGALVNYTLSAPAAVTFSFEKIGAGRKSGKKCVKQTKANKSKKKCDFYKPLRSGFTHTGTGHFNEFKFSGRVGGKALSPGRYLLVSRTGSSAQTAIFTIVK